MTWHGCLCLQVLAVAVHNHYKRLQNKRMHRAMEHAAQQQAAMVSVQGVASQVQGREGVVQLIALLLHFCKLGQHWPGGLVPQAASTRQLQPLLRKQYRGMCLLSECNVLLSWIFAEQESFAQKTHLVNGQPSQVIVPGLDHLAPLHAVGASPVQHRHDTTTSFPLVIHCNACTMLLLC